MAPGRRVTKSATTTETHSSVDLPTSPGGQRVIRSATITPLPVSRDTSTPLDSSLPDTHSSVASDARTSRVRGPTRGKGLEKFLNGGGKLKIDIHPILGRPTNPTQSAKLSSELGVLARNDIPHQYATWNAIPEDAKTATLARLKSRFDIDPSRPHVKKSCQKILKSQRRNNKAKLHKLFKTFSSLAEARQNCPNDMHQEDWDFYCDLFTSEKFKKRSEINKKNRSMLKVTHCMGSRAFVAARAHMEEEQKQTLGRVEWWKWAHYKEGEGWSCEKARELYEEMKELQRQSTQEDGTQTMTEDEIADKILGQRPGYVLGLGHGPRPTTSTTTSQQIFDQDDEEVVRLRAEIEELKHNQANEIEEIKQRQAHEIKQRQTHFQQMFESWMASGSTSTVGQIPPGFPQ